MNSLWYRGRARRILMSTALFTLAACLLAQCTGPYSSKDDGGASPSVIRLVHGPELRAFLSSVREQFMVKAPRLPNGDPVRLELISEMGLVAAQRIARGDLKTEGWIAPSSTLVSLTNESRINLGPEQVECTELFRTPVVVGARPDQVPLLRPEGSVFSWEHLFPRPKAGAPVKDDALPNFLSISHAQPRASTTGLASLIQLAYLASREPPPSRTGSIHEAAQVPEPGVASSPSIAPLEISRLRDRGSLETLKSYQRLVFTYPLSESFLLAKTATASGRRPRFALTTEQQLTQFNQQQSDPGMQLVALRTKEGTYWENYQLCMSNADWVSPGHRAALKLLKDFLLTPAVQADAKHLGFRSAAQAAPVATSPDAKTGTPPDLQDVPVLPPVLSEISSYLLDSWSNLRRPAAFILVLDSSGSMEGDALNTGKEQFRTLLAHSSPHDLKALVTFNSDSTVLSDFTKDSGEVIPKLDTIQAIGGSGVYDGIKSAIELAQKPNLEAYRKMIVVFTDGNDKNSEISLTSLMSLVRRSSNENDINLVIIAVDREGSDFVDLEKVAEAADGTFRRSALVAMENIFQEVGKGF